MLFVIILIGVLAYFWIFPRDKFKCPNDYATIEEYVDGTAKWISEKMDKNPNLSEEDILEIRTKELEKYRCESSKWMGN